MVARDSWTSCSSSCRLCELTLSPAVAHDDERFFIASPGFEMFQRKSDCVVQRGLALCRVSRKGGAEQIDVVAERNGLRKPGADFVIEINHEDLILWIAGANEYETRGNHIGPLGSHAAAVIEYQADGHRHVAAGEFRNPLGRSVFANLEVCLGESGDVPSPGVFDAYIEQNKLYVSRNPDFACWSGVLPQ